MKSLFQRFACCGSRSQIQGTAPQRRNTDSLRQDPNQSEENEAPTQRNEVRKKSLMKVHSKYKTSQITCSDFRQDSGEQYKYNCPICFRFFDRILHTSCCHNYICHFCVDDFNKKLIKESAPIEARCPFCNNTNFTLRDVNLLEKPKRYTDSPSLASQSKLYASKNYTERTESQFHPRTKKFTHEETQGEKELKCSLNQAFQDNHLNQENKPEIANRNSMNNQGLQDLLQHLQNQITQTSLQNFHRNNKTTSLKQNAQDIPILETSIEIEAIPSLPKNTVYKKSYKGMSSGSSD